MPNSPRLKMLRTLVLSSFCLLVFFSSSSTVAWGSCEKGLELYTHKSFDEALKVSYSLLTNPDLSPEDRICGWKILTISYYAKGDLYKDSVESYVKQIVELSPEYAFDPNDNWPPYCRDLLYKYQREWKKAHPSSASAKVTTLAILPFENRSIADRKELDPLREGLADMLITDLSKVVNLKIVERERLQSLLKEMGLAQSGVVDETTAAKVGRIEGAQSILFGSFLKLDKKHMRIDARIIKTETAQLIKADKVEGNPKKLLKMISELALKVAQHLNVSVSALERKKIGEVGKRSWEALLLYSKGLELEDQGEYKKAYKVFQKALKMDPDFVEAEKRFYNLQPLVK